MFILKESKKFILKIKKSLSYEERRVYLKSELRESHNLMLRTSEKFILKS
jgi:hypothetical protein